MQQLGSVPAVQKGELVDARPLSASNYRRRNLECLLFSACTTAAVY